MALAPQSFDQRDDLVTRCKHLCVVELQWRCGIRVTLVCGVEDVRKARGHAVSLDVASELLSP